MSRPRRPYWRCWLCQDWGYEASDRQALAKFETHYANCRAKVGPPAPTPEPAELEAVPC